MNYKIRFKILKEIYEERKRQLNIWGEQYHRPADYLMILGEEVGEVNRAALEAHFHGSSLKKYREELIQVAAVAMAMIEAYETQTTLQT
jgi:NTP pyrophosphatase (non-canonical NTP hydrolase)